MFYFGFALNIRFFGLDWRWAIRKMKLGPVTIPKFYPLIPGPIIIT